MYFGNQKIDRTGEARMMNNGLQATIIAYRYCEDMDIQFENGGIVQHVEYQHFKKGNIKCPMLFEYIDDYVRVTNPNVTPSLTFLIDKEDASILRDSIWNTNNRGYVCGWIDGKSQLLHRLIMQAPDNVLIDHINRNKSDNRKFNLRLCTNAENMCNRTENSNNTSGYKGVSWINSRKKWQAKIGVMGKEFTLGYFDDIKEAAKSYNEAALKHHGEFARINKIC